MKLFSLFYSTANKERDMLRHFDTRFCFSYRWLKSDFVCLTHSNLTCTVLTQNCRLYTSNVNLRCHTNYLQVILTYLTEISSDRVQLYWKECYITLDTHELLALCLKNYKMNDIEKTIGQKLPLKDYKVFKKD